MLCCWAPRVQRICRRKRGPADEISRAGGRAATTTGLPSPHAPYSLCPQQPHRLCPRPSHAWSTVLPLAETCPGRQTGERLGSRAIGRLPCVAVCAGPVSPTQGALLDNPVFFLAFFSGALCRAVLLCGNNRSGIGSARVSPGCNAFSGVEGGRLLHISHAALIFSSPISISAENVRFRHRARHDGRPRETMPRRAPVPAQHRQRCPHVRDSAALRRPLCDLLRALLSQCAPAIAVLFFSSPKADFVRMQATPGMSRWYMFHGAFCG